jgi:hypothetical protein
MTKKLTFLICTLILAGFGALDAVEPPSSVPSAQPSAEAVAPAPVEQPALDLNTFLNLLAPAPTPTASCPGGLHGPCDTNFHCRGYACPLGEVRTCFYSSGMGLCDGSCYCS